MKVNGDDLRDDVRSYQGLSIGRTTAKGKTIYLHVFDGRRAQLMSAASTRESDRAAAKGNQPLKFTQRGSMSLDVPAQAPDPNATVVALVTR